jgi:hypothetical protein
MGSNQPDTPTEYSLRTKTWMTDDGRWLTLNKIDSDHLANIYHWVGAHMTPGYDRATGCAIASAWMRGERAADAQLDQDAYYAAWLQIVEDELARRQPCHP